MRTVARPNLTRATLKKYTGWVSDNGIRLVITQQDDGSLRLGGLDIVRGNIIETWMLSFSDVPAFTIEGSALNRGLQAIAMVYPSGHMVTFGIEEGEIKDVKIGGVRYARIERGENMITKVPVEIRQMIWGYAL
jgi:hypothetical protein